MFSHLVYLKVSIVLCYNIIKLTYLVTHSNRLANCLWFQRKIKKIVDYYNKHQWTH